ncbi:uncharacterized protein FPRO_11620 [Fusarium proliferatum ET1]|uniref:C2H2-type domain-containing protein n=1 Tax=Fusarium proliferatum (strain ET1) TaxID=1227346 RepID=A0A1L7W0L2_FUSPR|nr:uncharacterized protein FPRO_11620 [Fusarium proliferatum ET1]CZR46173.1 uncharacterized protein FPRO_11620 [Fusarium proliferatum ET1]
MTETKFHKPPTSQTASQPNGSPTPSLDAREVKQVNTGQCDPWADHQPNAPVPGCVAPLYPGHDMGSQRLSLEDTEDGDAVDDIQPWEQELAASEWFRTLVLELTTYTFEKFRIWKERLERISPIKDETSFSERFGPSFIQPATHKQTGDEYDLVREGLVSSSRPSSSAVFLYLACPFYVYDHEQCRECLLTGDLRNIEDLVEHLFQCHSRLLYCPHCYETFESQISRDDHVLEEKCQKRVPSQIFGLSESQKVKLFDVDIESQCIDQQALWFRIWSIVFPDTMEPQSWLLDRDPGLSISMMRDFWNSNGLKYIALFLEDRRISQENSTKLTDMLYQRVLKDLLTGVMNERTCSRTALAPG